MRRREFIAGLGGAAAWPVAAPAQPVMRRVTVILGFEKGDEEGQSRLAAFVETLAGLGWSDGRSRRCSPNAPFAKLEALTVERP
jgi:putative ABC transport system substrate-binding protein